MNSREYYEKYWLQETPPPDSDPTVGQRQRLLLKCFTRFGPKTETASAVLDAGCGGGEFLEFFADRSFCAVGLDISLTALQKAKKRIPRTPIAAASLDEGLCFKPNSFELVWFTEVLEHLLDTSQALSEIHRILKPQGLLALTTPYHGFIKNLAIAVTRFDKHFDVAGPHIRFFTRRSLSASLKRAGFDLLHSEGFGRCWPLYKSLFVVASKS
jgi:2-polyprenyl-6-hydroxyphenyl methylase/3-demethylubiquinone-9 3-methyltransferase